MRYYLVIVMVLLAGAAGATDWSDFMSATPRTLLAQQDTTASAAGALQAPAVPELPGGSHKNGGKALLLSAILPGAGQAYSGSWLKAAGFLAVEATGWYLYSSYSAKGDDIEKEYLAFAQAHWSEEQYWLAIASMSGLTPGNIDALREWEHSNFSHGLHVDKDQQYWEMIGKYNQFNYGWDDVYIDTPRPVDKLAYLNEQEVSERRLHYVGRRDDSNTALRHATISASLVMINHLCSALDATWTVARQNRTAAEARLYFEPRRLGPTPYTALTLRMDW